ncbi:basic blue protein-like protein [Tanacetum coccineum]
MATTNLNKIIVVIATITALAILVAAQTGGVTNVVHDMGREKGWTYGFDYQGYINQYEVFVGDKLRFRYPPGEHDVVEVDEENFQKCTVPPGAKILTSGDDYIDITSPGKKYYICSVKDGHHCRDGKMKFYVNVPKPYLSSADSTGSTGIQGTRKLVTEKL